MHAVIYGAAAFGLALTMAPAQAEDPSFELVPASFSPAIAAVRMQPSLVEPKLTDDVLAAYVMRQQQLANFDGFDIPDDSQLNEQTLSSYIARSRNDALDAIAQLEISPKPALTADALASYIDDDFVPTAKKVEVAEEEMTCLTQAIYHEARGETENGQMAVANIIVNRAMSNRYPSTICGVVFQNADKGRFRCQFTFACDGRSDYGTERRAWARAERLAEVAYREFQRGEHPGIIPNSALYYHTTSVRPKWSYTFQRVAAIGSHVFYAQN